MVKDDPIDALHSTWTSLTLQWQVAKGCWRDQVSLDFERIYWSPIAADTKALMQSVHSLEETIARALRETA